MQITDVYEIGFWISVKRNQFKLLKGPMTDKKSMVQIEKTGLIKINGKC